METLRQHDLAYFDSFSGLIPCKVTSITGDSGLASTSQVVSVVLTASRNSAYTKGSTVVTSALHIVPRKAVRFRKYGTKIAAYSVEVKP